MKVIRIIVSSGALAKQLSKIDFATDSVAKVARNKHYLVIENRKGAQYLLPGDGFKNDPDITLEQDNCRWDWLYKTVKNIPDQPIVLTIGEKMVSVKLDF